MNARTAVVTGAASGIGTAICRELASVGHRVYVTGRSASAISAVASELPSATAVELDVTDPAQCARVAEQVVQECGHLDVWVSNAGISKMAPFVEKTPDDLEQTISVNLNGVFFGGQAAARAMIDVGAGGTIINISSIAGKSGRLPYLSDYIASKFAVTGMTQAMAYELAPHNIRVNAVCPGFVVTPMQERELQWEADLRKVSVSDVRAGWLADTPIGRLQAPADVADAVAFLVSDKASYITGESLAVNGGVVMD